jgi:hypothetical protein
MTGGQALVRPLRAEVVKVVFEDSSFSGRISGDSTLISFSYPSATNPSCAGNSERCPKSDDSDNSMWPLTARRKNLQESCELSPNSAQCREDFCSPEIDDLRNIGSEGNA